MAAVFYLEVPLFETISLFSFADRIANFHQVIVYPPVVPLWLLFYYLEVPLFETISLSSLTDRIAKLS